MPRLSRILVSIYAGVALILFLYAYPWIPDKTEMMIISLGLAWAAAYPATTTPLFTGFVYSGSIILSALTLAAATGQPWLLIAMHDMILFTALLVYTLIAAAAVLSVRRRDVAGLATGAVAAASLKMPEGVYAAPLLVAMYAAVSGNARGAVIAALVYSYMYTMLLTTLWAAGSKLCYSSLVSPVLKPVKPVVEALLSPSQPQPIPATSLYPVLVYSTITTIISVLIAASIARLASSIESRIATLGASTVPTSKTVLASAPLLTLLGYFITVDAETLISNTLSCITLTSVTIALVVGLAGALLSTLYKLAKLLAELRGVEEERQSILESLSMYEREVRRIRDELSKRGLLDEHVNALLKSVEEGIEGLREKALHAGLLDLPLLERMLAALEKQYHNTVNNIITHLYKTAEELVRGCNAIAAYAAENGLPKDCSEAMNLLQRLRGINDLYNLAVNIDKLRRTIVEYLELLVEEIEERAEEVGVKLEELREWREVSAYIEQLNNASLETIRKTFENLLGRLSSAWGRVRSREA